MLQRLCSVSVDLDPLRCYCQIHGLPAPDRELADVVLVRALPRFLELLDRHHLRATFFVVGSDLDGLDSPSRKLLAQAVAAGHELGNHSLSHHYDLARRTTAEIEREIGDSHRALRAIAGKPPVGFRAPGYELSPELFDVLEAFAYRYDSSLFPCPPYYLAKLAVLGKMTLTRQRSQAIVGSPLAQLAPSQPYRPHPKQPWRRGQAGLVELPVAVTPWLRLPAIGTSLLATDWLRGLLLRSMGRQRFFNLELHGMDLLGAAEDGLPEALHRRQIDLRVPLDERMRAFTELLDHLHARCNVMPLCDVAEMVQRRGELA